MSHTINISLKNIKPKKQLQPNNIFSSIPRASKENDKEFITEMVRVIITIEQTKWRASNTTCCE